MHILPVVAVSALCLAACEGPAGPPGSDGKDGSGLRSSTFCVGFFEVDSVGRGFDVAHGVYRYTDGSVLTTCEVSGGLTQTTGVYAYKSSQSGADSGGCVVTFDVDSSSSGFWDFSLRTGGAESIAKYSDKSSIHDLRFTVLKCTTK